MNNVIYVILHGENDFCIGQKIKFDFGNFAIFASTAEEAQGIIKEWDTDNGGEGTYTIVGILIKNRELLNYASCAFTGGSWKCSGVMVVDIVRSK